MLDEVHLAANGSTADDVITREKNVELQPRDDCCDKGSVNIGKEWNHTDQLLTVKVDNVLKRK